MSEDAPPRLDVDPEVPALAANALRAARDDVPDEDHLRRVEGLLMARLALAAGGGTGGSGGGNPGTGGPPPATGAAPGVAGGGASLGALLGGGLAVVALVCGALYASAPSPAGPAPAPPAIPSQPIVVTPPASFVPPSHSAPTPPAPSVVSIDDLPREPAGSALAKPAPSASAAPVDPKEETKLVGSAQASLRSDPAATLRACNDHAKKFPTGALAQECDALAIEALVALGRAPEAKTRLAKFRASYPGSGHLRKLEGLF